MTGGLALDAGLVDAMKEAMVRERSACRSRAIPTPFSPAPSALRWGAFRHESCRSARQLRPTEEDPPWP